MCKLAAAPTALAASPAFLPPSRDATLKTVDAVSRYCCLCSGGTAITRALAASPLAFAACELGNVVNTETEVILYALLDLCAVSISCAVISANGRNLEEGLLPAQEDELSLYPGPHKHGFFPNPDYYEDNV